MATLAVVVYVLGLLPPALHNDAQAFETHLYLRGAFCVMGTIGIVAGLLLNRPASAWPWIWLAALTLAYAIRPVMVYHGLTPWAGGWGDLGVIALQGALGLSALWAIVLARRSRCQAAPPLELLMFVVGYGAFQFAFNAANQPAVALQLPLALAMNVVQPVGYMLSAAVLVRLMLVNRVGGRAFTLMGLAWASTILVDAVGPIAPVPVDPFAHALLDPYALASFLWAAAALHPSMSRVTDPDEESTWRWDAHRSAVAWLGLLLPMVGMLAPGLSGAERGLILILGSIGAGLAIWHGRRGGAGSAQAQRQRVEQTDRDALTGMLNRRGLIEAALRHPQRALGVAFLDIDGFKLLNHANGHEFGDRLLIAVCARLLQLRGPFSAPARIGDDEFALLLHRRSGALQPASEVVGAWIQDLFAEPLQIEGRAVRVRVSAGLAHEAGVPPGAARPVDDRQRIGALFRRANIALHYAQARGGANSCVYSEQMLEARERKREIINVLDRLGETDELWIAFQAIVDMHSGRVVGAEALARMQTPSLGAVPPEEFTRIAERSGHAIALGSWVLRSVVASVRALQGSLPDGFRVAVNCSPRQLSSDDAIDHMIAESHAWQPLLGILRLEISESTLLDDGMIGRLGRLKAAGFQLVIDDFGSEHAALQHLGRVDVSAIKLDRAFVQRLTEDATSRSIVRHVIELAEELNIDLVTEGVETVEQRRILCELGGRLGQGFLWDRPAAGLGRLIAPR